MNKLTDTITNLDIINHVNDVEKQCFPKLANWTDVSFPANDTFITAPNDGFFVVIVKASGTYSQLIIDLPYKAEFGFAKNPCTTSALMGGYLPVCKGDLIWIRYSGVSKVWDCGFWSV